jgi:hypothetical protein
MRLKMAVLAPIPSARENRDGGESRAGAQRAQSVAKIVQERIGHMALLRRFGPMVS